MTKNKTKTKIEYKIYKIKTFCITYGYPIICVFAKKVNKRIINTLGTITHLVSSTTIN